MLQDNQHFPIAVSYNVVGNFSSQIKTISKSENISEIFVKSLISDMITDENSIYD